MTEQRRALITGITGMDGSHLADLLLQKDYEVHGLFRRCSRSVDERLAHLDGSAPDKTIFLHDGDMLDQGSLNRVVGEVQPHEIYNLAAQSFVGASWDQPVLTAEITGLGTLRLLEAVRMECHQETRFYQASSSEMFGNQPEPQDELTPLHPRSPYGAAKLFAHRIAINYRESYDLFVSCGILFNHESERRGHEFVTRKIARQVAEAAMGKRDEIKLGNLAACRDWGYAPDYVEAMWRMLQHPEPEDFVVATGETHTVGEFLDKALLAAGGPTLHVVSDPAFHRPAELYSLRGDAGKAKELLGWAPSVSFSELVQRMVNYDLVLMDSRC